MRFPGLERVALPALLAEFREGRQHPDGRRYLPLIVLELGHPEDTRRIGVVDRHHRVSRQDAGRAGVARLVFHLSRVRLQAAGERRQGLDAPGEGGGLMLAPAAHGRIVEILAWEQHRKLGYDSLYVELLLDIGPGAVAMRTNVTGESLAGVLAHPEGTRRLAAGDWISLEQSRIDILAFVPDGGTR